MVHVLDVNAGDTYRVDSGTTETHARTEIDGTLSTQGTLHLTGKEPRAIKPPKGIDLPREIDLPMGINFPGMNMGIAVFLIGTLATTLSASWALKNYAAGIMWGVALIALLIGGIMGMGLELFWMAIIATVVLLIVGFIVRWSAA